MSNSNPGMNAICLTLRQASYSRRLRLILPLPCFHRPYMIQAISIVHSNPDQGANCACGLSSLAGIGRPALMKWISISTLNPETIRKMGNESDSRRHSVGLTFVPPHEGKAASVVHHR